jgi:hypothetical protein
MTHPEGPETPPLPAQAAEAAAPAAHGLPGQDDGVPSLSILTPVTAPTGPRRPMVRATRITLFEREVRERLSRAALDLIFARADLLSEGQRSTRAGADTYFGSTMLTIDLETLSHVLRDACDVATARRLAALMEADAEVPGRVRTLARRESARRSARAADAHGDSRARNQGVRGRGRGGGAVARPGA